MSSCSALRLGFLATAAGNAGLLSRVRGANPTLRCLCAQFRFAMLCQAALEVPLQVPLNGSLYGQKCMFLANDWHGAMTSAYLAGKYRPHGVYTESRCILAIHNLRHQVCTHPQES